jgi:uncharacterized protein YciI
MHFLIFLHGARPTLLNDMTPEEGATVGEHFAYLQKALAEGKLLMAGRREGYPLGIAVIDVEDAAAAEQFLAEDPAIVRGVFRGEVHPFRLALFSGKP